MCGCRALRRQAHQPHGQQTPERAILSCQPSHWRREAMKRAPYTKKLLAFDAIEGQSGHQDRTWHDLMLSQLSDYMRQMFRSSTRLTGSGANFLNSTRPLLFDASGTS